MSYQYYGAYSSDDESRGLHRLPSEESDEDIDPDEYERQARERQRILLDQAETQRRCWQNWTPEVVIRKEVPKAKSAPKREPSSDHDEKKVDDARDGYSSDNSFDETKRGDELYHQFRNYSLSGYMDCKRFVSLCYDSFLIPFDTKEPDLCQADAKKLFADTLQSFYDPVVKLCTAPILNSCIPYSVFLDNLIPLIAIKKAMSDHDVIMMLKKTVAGNRRYWSEADGPKQLLLKREKLGNGFIGEEEAEGKHDGVGGRDASALVARGSSEARGSVRK